MDTGHFISFHADSLGNIPYNIVYSHFGLWHSPTTEARGETRTEREQNACTSIAWANF